MSSKSLHFIKRVIKVIAPYQNTINPTKRECRDSTSTKIKTPHLFSEVLPSIRLNYGQQEFFSIPNFVWKKLPAAWNTDPPADLSFWSICHKVLPKSIGNDRADLKNSMRIRIRIVRLFGVLFAYFK